MRRFLRSGCGTTSNLTTWGCGGGGGALRTGGAPAARRRVRRGWPTGMSNCRTTTARAASAAVAEGRRIRVGFGRASFFCCCASRSPAAARTAARRSETKILLRRSTAARKLSIRAAITPSSSSLQGRRAFLRIPTRTCSILAAQIDQSSGPTPSQAPDNDEMGVTRGRVTNQSRAWRDRWLRDYKIMGADRERRVGRAFDAKWDGHARRGPRPPRSVRAVGAHRRGRRAALTFA